MSERKPETLTVSYLLTDKEMDVLNRLNQKYREYVNPEGCKPFANQSVEELFGTIMTTGSGFVIADKVGFAMMQMGLISAEEWLSRSKVPIDLWDTGGDDGEGKHSGEMSASCHAMEQ